MMRIYTTIGNYTVAKKHPRDVDCDIVCGAGGSAGGQTRGAAPSPSPPVFVMQIAAPAAPPRAASRLTCCNHWNYCEKYSFVRLKDPHHHNADILFKETKNKSNHCVQPTSTRCYEADIIFSSKSTPVTGRSYWNSIANWTVCKKFVWSFLRTQSNSTIDLTLSYYKRFRKTNK